MEENLKYMSEELQYQIDIIDLYESTMDNENYYSVLSESFKDKVVDIKNKAINLIKNIIEKIKNTAKTISLYIKKCLEKIKKKIEKYKKEFKQAKEMMEGKNNVFYLVDIKNIENAVNGNIQKGPYKIFKNLFEDVSPSNIPNKTLSQVTTEYERLKQKLDESYEFKDYIFDDFLNYMGVKTVKILQPFDFFKQYQKNLEHAELQIRQLNAIIEKISDTYKVSFSKESTIYKTIEKASILSDNHIGVNDRQEYNNTMEKIIQLKLSIMSFAAVIVIRHMTLTRELISKNIKQLNAFFHIYAASEETRNGPDTIKNFVEQEEELARKEHAKEKNAKVGHDFEERLQNKEKQKQKSKENNNINNTLFLPAANESYSLLESCMRLI